MTPFMNEDFLLTNETARKLYHDAAKKMPIVDYHCHLDPQQIYEDSLNPADDQWLDTLLGAYQGTEVSGKIQHGSAWWFNDNRTGMVNQMTSLANLGILGNFIGMLTDSRSFLSYARHEYFRRILCNLIGTWVENGEYPADMETLGELVADICCRNAMRYFNL